MNTHIPNFHHVHIYLYACTIAIGNLSSIWPLFWDFSNTIIAGHKKGVYLQSFYRPKGTAKHPMQDNRKGRIRLSGRIYHLFLLHVYELLAVILRRETR